jgi:hypothetical protein
VLLHLARALRDSRDEHAASNSTVVAWIVGHLFLADLRKVAGGCSYCALRDDNRGLVRDSREDWRLES